MDKLAETNSYVLIPLELTLKQINDLKNERELKGVIANY
jgi:hypothetical protein